MAKFEFGSPEWVAAVHGVVRDLMKDQSLEGITYSLSERYVNPPSHLLEYAPLGWHLIIENGSLVLGSGPLDSAERNTVADYTSIVPLALVDFDATPEALESFQKDALAMLASGALSTEGRASSEVFPCLSALHDRIAKITLDITVKG